MKLTVRAKLTIAFGLCAALMLLLGGASAFGLVTAGVHVRPIDRMMMEVQAAMGLGTGVAAIGFGWWIYRTVCVTLDRMVARFEDIATTLDLTKRLIVRQDTRSGQDEFDAVAIAFDQLMTQIEEAVLVVRKSTGEVAKATGEIASGNRDLSARTEEQAASLEQTAASMEQLTQTVRQNAESAQTATGLVSGARQNALRANEVVSEVVATMSGISESSAKISEITGMIEGIAFQTNILALNAAVESARAGEQGRGFAVVAGEVRSLAQRAANAAREIRRLIESSVEQVRVGSELAGQASQNMQELNRSVLRVADIMDEIAVASSEQGRGIEQVSMAVSQIDQVTQRNAALVATSATAMQLLDEQAGKLENAIAVFRLRNHGNDWARIASL